MFLGNYITVMIPLVGNRAWVGTDERIGVFDGGKLIERIDQIHRYGWGSMSGLAFDSHGHLWTASGAGISCIRKADGSDGKRPEPLSYFIDSTGHEEFATFECRGVARIRQWPAMTGLPTNNVRAVCLDASGRKWLGTAKGACCFDGDTWRTYGSSDGLVNESVRAIAVDKADRKWFGTDGGVSCYDGRAWTSWTKNDHLAENGIRSLAVDIDGSIWVATEKGVSHIVLEKSE